MSSTRRGVGAVLTAVIVGLALIVPAVVGPRAGAAPVPLHLVEVTDWNSPSSVFRATVQFQDLPDDARLTFTLHTPITGRDELDPALTGRRLGGTLLSGDLTRSGSTGTLEIPISPRWPAPDRGAVLSDPGVHPVVIRAVASDGTELGRLVTELIRLPDTSSTPPLGVGIVVDVIEPQATALDGSTYLDATGQQSLEATIAAIDGAPGVPLTLRPSAMTLEEYAASSENRQPLLDRLRATPSHQIISAPWAPIAMGSWLAADLVPEARDQLAAGPATVTRLTGSTPDPRISVLDPTVDDASLAILHAAGTESLIIPSDRVPSLGTQGDAALTQQFAVRDGDGTVFRALASDQRITDRLARDGDPIAVAHDAVADLALLRLASQSPARGLAVVIPTEVSPPSLRAFLHAMGDRDGGASGAPAAALVSPVTIDDLFSVTDAATSTTPSGTSTTTIRSFTSDEPIDLGAYPAALRAARDEIAGLTSLVPETPSLRAPATDRTLASGDRSLDADRRGAAIASVHGAISAVTGEIVMSPQQIVTLTSHSGRVPLNIENRLPVPAHVHVRLTSAKLDFPEGAEFDQVLEPATTTRVDAQVTTRASGAFPLDVSITSADDTLAVTGARFTVRSTAISGVGLVISVGAGLFLLLWWVRHFRTNRRAAQLVAPVDPPAGEPEPENHATDEPE